MTSVDDRDTRDALSRRAAGLTSGALSMLTREAGRVPMLAIGAGLEAWQRTAGVRRLVRRRGDEILQIVASTPLGRFLPHPVIDDGAEEEAVRITSAVRATEQTEAAAARPAPPAAAVEAGAPGVVTEAVDKIAEQLEIAEPQSRDELPIPNFDNVSIGSLRARLRSLSVEQLVTLREWEQAHAHRLPVLTLLDNRIAKVSAQEADGAATYPAEPPAAGSINSRSVTD